MYVCVCVCVCVCVQVNVVIKYSQMPDLSRSSMEHSSVVQADYHTKPVRVNEVWERSNKTHDRATDALNWLKDRFTTSQG